MNIFICLTFLMFALSACSYLNQKLGLKDDNLGEEVVEDVIKGRTGIDVDLTPSTPEK